MKYGLSINKEGKYRIRHKYSFWPLWFWTENEDWVGDSEEGILKMMAFYRTKDAAIKQIRKLQEQDRKAKKVKTWIKVFFTLDND